jgi:hypothetical protein
MAFDMNMVAQNMLGAAEGVLKDEWPKAKGAMKQVLQDHARALQAIAEARIAGKINDEDCQRQIEDENETLQAGLAMVRVIDKKMAQDAINSALRVFTEAVKAAIGGLV